MNAVGRQLQRSAASTHYQRQHSDSSLDFSSNNNRWLQSSTATASAHDLSACPRMFRTTQQLSGDIFTELPLIPPVCSRSSSQRKNGEEDLVFPSELGSAILDLHSLDTELLSDGRSFEDLEPYLSTNKHISKPRGLPENNILRSFSTDTEKGSSVAKIKVVVDLTEYVEKHEFVFDAVLDEKVSNDEVYRETGVHCSNYFSAHKGNLLCIWANSLEQEKRIATVTWSVQFNDTMKSAFQRMMELPCEKMKKACRALMTSKFLAFHRHTIKPFTWLNQSSHC